jgi:hypothetical protein
MDETTMIHCRDKATHHRMLQSMFQITLRIIPTSYESDQGSPPANIPSTSEMFQRTDTER